jgi:hypothetical protein
MSLGWLSRSAVLGAIVCVSLSTAHASNFSFASFFTQDDQRQVITFDGASASVTIVTFGYAGGINQAGQSIAAGGFDPVLSLFDATGGLTAASNLIAFTDSTGCGGVNQDPTTLSCFDEKLVLTTLLPGNTYALVLTQSDNLPVGATFGDGFTQDGNGNFTPGEFGCAANSFCDANIPSSERTGNWALDILGVRSATGPTSVPEPGGPWLPAGGAGGILLLAVRASAKARKDRP